jgi:hypothetical protein
LFKAISFIISYSNLQPLLSAAAHQMMLFSPSAAHVSSCFHCQLAFSSATCTVSGPRRRLFPSSASLVTGCSHHPHQLLLPSADPTIHCSRPHLPDIQPAAFSSAASILHISCCHHQLLPPSAAPTQQPTFQLLIIELFYAKNIHLSYFFYLTLSHMEWGYNQVESPAGKPSVLPITFETEYIGLFTYMT